jgi:excinuclease ABC subunit B
MLSHSRTSLLRNRWQDSRVIFTACLPSLIHCSASARQWRQASPQACAISQSMFIGFREVSLVAILDADNEGFLRSQGSLIQTIGRAARHVEGRAILYADKMTDSMRRAIDETDRRREKQEAFNVENGITPMSIVRPLEMGLAGIMKADYIDLTDEAEGIPEFATQAELDAYIANLESDMREAARKFEFEKAVKLRDTVKDLRSKEFLFS